MRRPRLCLASQTRRFWGCRPGPIRGSATEVGWTGQAAAGNRRAARQPSPRKNGPLATNPAMERPKGAFCYYQGASFGAPSPLKKGRKLKAQLARRREDEKPWLFEI